MAAAPDYQRRVEHVEELGTRSTAARPPAEPVGDEDLSSNAVLAADELLANCFVHTDDGCTIRPWLDHGPQAAGGGDDPATTSW